MSGVTTYFAPADRRALVLPGVAADHTFTFEIRAYRKVDKDINAAGVIVSNEVATTPYQPVTAPVYLGDIQGTIQGRGSLEVVESLEAIASDSVLSTTEKPGLILSYNQAQSDWNSLHAKAQSLGNVATQDDAASAAFTALTNYLNGLVPAWNDTQQNTTIDKATFQAKWASFYSSIADLNAAINGQPGANAVTLVVISDRQTIAYDSTGAASPANQDIHFTAQKQNTTAAVTWSVTDANGVAQNAATLLSATTGNTITMSTANFATARNGTSGVIVTGSITVNGVTITDKISISRVQNGAAGAPGSDGATGPAGPTIMLTADDLSFDFIDGVPFNSGQVINLTAILQNTAEAIDWTASPAVTLTAGADGNHKSISLANFGANTQVVITATGHTSGAKATVTLIRNDQTTPNDSLIPDTGWNATAINGGLNQPLISGRPWAFTGATRVALP